MRSSHNTQYFSQIVSKLLAGDIICVATEPALFKYLKNGEQHHDIDGYLRRIDRLLKSTQDGAGYFAAYRHINEGDAKTNIRRQFSEVINDLEPLVRWLRLSLSAEKKRRPLQVGDALRGSELLESIENAPALVDELEKISRTRLFSNKSTGAKKQLDSVLSRLCDSGYLINKGATGSMFIATAKWSRLYELMDYIAVHEQIEMPEEDQEQQDLLS